MKSSAGVEGLGRAEHVARDVFRRGVRHHFGRRSEGEEAATTETDETTNVGVAVSKHRISTGHEKPSRGIN